MTKTPKAPSGADQAANKFLEDDADPAKIDSTVEEEDDDNDEDEEEEIEEEKPKKQKIKGRTPYPAGFPKRIEMRKDETPSAYVLKGRFGKFRLPASMNISSQMLPPITKRTFAIYELCDYFDTATGRKKIDPRIQGGDQSIDPPPYELVDNYQFHDYFEPDLAKRDKILTYHGGVETFSYENPVTKQQENGVRPKRLVPFFTNGQVRVEIEKHYPQFVWWELHPRNETNKRRDKQKPPVFRRIDLDFHSSHVDILRMDLQSEAYNYVRRLNHSELIALASAMSNPTISVTTNDNDIRVALLHRSRTSPEEVLYKSPDKVTAASLDIINSLDWGILDFDAQTNTYTFSNMPDEPAYVVPLEEKPIEGFAKFLIGEIEGEEEDGKTTYQLMRDLVEFWR